MIFKKRVRKETGKVRSGKWWRGHRSRMRVAVADRDQDQGGEDWDFAIRVRGTRGLINGAADDGEVTRDGDDDRRGLSESDVSVSDGSRRARPGRQVRARVRPGAELRKRLGLGLQGAYI